MSDPSRRTVLASAGAGLASLAGCSAFSGGDEDGDPEYDEAALRDAAGEADSLLAPDAFPVGLTRNFQDRHRERARVLLEEVPAAPSFPNEAVTAELRDDRESVAETLETSATGRPLDRLETWRDRRGDAARVRGSYRAAAGDLDRETVASWRDQVGQTLREFERDWAYRASGPVEAAVVHATLEELRERAGNAPTAPRSFPADPVADPFQAGQVAGDVERAGAAVVDADRIRTRYREDDAVDASYRTHLATASRRLDHSLSLSSEDVEPHLDESSSPLEADVRDAPGGIAVRAGSRRVTGYRDGLRRSRGRHHYASATLDAGRGLVALEGLDAVVRAVENGGLRATPTVERVRAARERAVGSLEAAWTTEPQSLAVELAVPALHVVRGAARRAREGYGGPARPYALFVLGEAMARAVPEATRFVADHLGEADEP